VGEAMDGEAPGGPGLPGRWTSGQKGGVGTALGGSAIWFTLSHGILNEVYAGRMDRAAIRDLGLVVTADGGYFSEEKRHAVHAVHLPVTGVPAYRLVNTCAQGRYRVVKDVITDPDRPVVLQRIRFDALAGNAADYRLYALLASHLENHGAGNTAWVGTYKGEEALFARRGGAALCLLARDGFAARSVGYVGSSDGWQDLHAHGRLARQYACAADGNVALTGELRLAGGETVLALAFAATPEEAAHQARAALVRGFDPALNAYVDPWLEWRDGLDGRLSRRPLFAVSAMAVRCHRSKHVPGAIVASLAVPWGFAKGDGDLGGYHLVWPRDMVEAAGGLLAAGDGEAAREALTYLAATQEADGHWPQNMWLEGAPYWSGIQMDETAMPILLVDLARREGALSPDGDDVRRLWPMVRRAAAYLVRYGPVTQQDRWEEDGGYTPFTLAVEIAALLVAAEIAGEVGEGHLTRFLTETADAWNDAIERWLYREDTALARQVGVPGYYVRIAPPDVEDGDDVVAIRNRPAQDMLRSAAAVVSADALALVRLGLRRADDPRIVGTVRVVDALLKGDTPAGPGWRRYNDDGYGEHEDGSPFDGTGVGRLWPLLTGERGHYALAAGDVDEAERLAATLEGLAGEGGMLPEQTWDSADIPDRELWLGRPAGSAMPLVWAHAEYLKLCRSLADGRVFDMPGQTVRRYLDGDAHAPFVAWRLDRRVRRLAAGKRLRVELPASALVHWSADGWATRSDLATTDSGLGVHYADLPVATVAPGGAVVFTLYWTGEARWEGQDFRLAVEAPVREGVVSRP